MSAASLDILNHSQCFTVCERCLFPLLCAHFVNIIGTGIAKTLCRPPPVPYAVQCSPDSMDVTVDCRARQQFHKLSVDNLLESIHRPSSSQSRVK